MPFLFLSVSIQKSRVSTKLAQQNGVRFVLVVTHAPSPLIVLKTICKILLDTWMNTMVIPWTNPRKDRQILHKRPFCFKTRLTCTLARSSTSILSSMLPSMILRVFPLRIRTNAAVQPMPRLTNLTISILTCNFCSSMMSSRRIKLKVGTRLI